MKILEIKINQLVFVMLIIMLTHILYTVVGGASAASEATLSSCPLRFAVYVGG